MFLGFINYSFPKTQPNTRNAVVTKHATFDRYHVDRIKQGGTLKYCYYIYPTVIKTILDKLSSRASTNKTAPMHNNNNNKSAYSWAQHETKVGGQGER
jgi:hypothetical protein